jgi:hypothetical protein
MGLPFSNGHYLARRQFPATTFALPYLSVWHRDPSCSWTFYATTPGQQSCARYFGSATPNDAVQCDIDVSWVGPWSVLIEIPGSLHWTRRPPGDGGYPADEHDRQPAVRVGVVRPDHPEAAEPCGQPNARRP